MSLKTTLLAAAAVTTLALPALAEMGKNRVEGANARTATSMEEGFEIAAGETILLKRGGRHVMFLGLTDPFEQGEMIDVTLTFEKAGDIDVKIPVDLERQPEPGAHAVHDHGDHSHGSHSHSHGHHDHTLSH